MQFDDFLCKSDFLKHFCRSFAIPGIISAGFMEQNSSDTSNNFENQTNIFVKNYIKFQLF